jgi:hypothetical protein
MQADRPCLAKACPHSRLVPWAVIEVAYGA